MTLKTILFYLFICSFTANAQEGFFKKFELDSTAMRAGNVRGVYTSIDNQLWLLNGINESSPDEIFSTLSKVSVYIDPILTAQLSLKNSNLIPHIMAFAEDTDKSLYFFIHMDTNPELTIANSNIFIAKFDEFGTQLWVKNITPKSTGVYQFLFDAKADIVVLPNNDIVVQHTSYDPVRLTSENIMYSMSPSGQVKWSKTIKNPAMRQMKMVYNIPLGAIIWTGHIYNNNTSSSEIYTYHLNALTGEYVKANRIAGLASQIPISFNQTSLHNLVYLTNNNTVLMSSPTIDLLWAYKYEDSKQPNTQMIQTIAMPGNATGIIIRRAGFLGSEILKIDADGDVLLSRRYGSFSLSGGNNYPGFSNNEIYAPANTQNPNGTLREVGMVHLHEDLSVSPCEKIPYCFEKKNTSIVLSSHKNDLDNYLLDTAIIQQHAFVWTTIASSSMEHCAFGTDPAAHFITKDTICLGEKVVFSELKNQSADSSTWLTSGGVPEKLSQLSPPNLIFPKSGNYTIRHVMKVGCRVDTFDKRITVLDLPVLNIPDSIFICSNNTKLEGIEVAHANSFLWHDGITTIEREFTSEGKYFIQAFNLSGCATTDSITARIIQLDANFTEEDVACTGDTLDLLQAIKSNNPQLATYTWTSPDSASLSLLSNNRINWTKGGSYELTLKVSINTCETEKTSSINVYETPKGLNYSDTVTCDPLFEVLLSSLNAKSWLWSDKDTAFVKNIYPPGGRFSYTLNNGLCVSQNSLQVDFLDLSGRFDFDSVVCLDDEVVLKFMGNQLVKYDSVVWIIVPPSGLFPPRFTSLEVPYTFTQIGRHEVQFIAYKAGCEAAFIAHIIVNEAPIIDIGLQGPHLLIESIVLKPTVKPHSTTLSWTDGYPELFRTITSPGTYEIKAEMGKCISTSSITIYRVDVLFVPNIIKRGGEPLVVQLADPSLEILDFIIYDRWGNAVFQTSEDKWEMQGIEQGVYAYLIRIRFQNGDVSVIKGDVTVVE